MILYSKAARRPSEAAPQGTLARDREGCLWEQTAPGTARHWERFSANGPVSRVVWSSGSVPVSPSNVTNEVDYIRPIAEGKTYLYATSFVVTDPLVVHGLVMPLTVLEATSQVRVKAAVFECLPGDRKTQWPWRLVHQEATYQFEGEIDKSGPFFVPALSLSAQPIFLPAGRYYILHIWDSDPDGMDPEISGAKFAIRRARDIRGLGAAGGNNLFVGDRAAKGQADDQLESFRTYATIDFSQIVTDGGSSDPIGSDPEFVAVSPKVILHSPMAYMDIGLQAEVYPN